MQTSNISETLLNPPLALDSLNYLTFGNAEPDVELMNELLAKCPNIKFLNIQHVSLNALPNIGLCPNLTSLSVSAPIEKVSFSLQGLTKLQSFQAINWQMEDFSFLAGQLQNLTNLQIYATSKRWSNLPNLSQWKHLNNLRLENCQDVELLTNQEELPVLHSVNLTNCRYVQLPKFLTNCPELRSVYLLKMPKVDLAEFWENLPNLHYLTLGGMPVEGIIDLPNKSVDWFSLNLFENDLTFENLDFVDNMPNLSSLNLDGNQLLNPLSFLRKKALPLKTWPIMPDNFKFKDIKVFNAISAAIAKSKLSETDKEFFINYLMTRTKLDTNKRWDWGTILKASNISHLHFRKKLQTLIDEKIAAHETVEDWSNAVIYVTGKTKMKVTELKNKIAELGMQYTKDYSDKVTHIVIGMSSPDYELLADKTFIPITETQLQQRFSDTQPQYLKETAAEEGGEEMMKNLGNLLTSSDVANVKIGIEMVKSGGMPPGLFDQLLIVQKTTADAKIRKVVQQLLEVEAPLEWKPFVRDRLSFKMVHSNKPESDIRRQIAAVAKRIKPTMAAKFSMLLFQHTGRGLRYALTARLAKGIKEEAYQLLLKDNHFDFSKGLGMTPLANRVDDYYALPTSSVSLPVPVLKMATIHSLNLHNCRYNAVNSDIVAFKDLKHLDYSDNDLTGLPDYLKELTHLETLDLRNHMFRTFPPVLLEMPGLKKIDLRVSRTDYRYGVMEIPAEFKRRNPDCAVFV
jgi:Leucine-rich repeat (LRR) protein